MKNETIPILLALLQLLFPSSACYQLRLRKRSKMILQKSTTIGNKRFRKKITTHHLKTTMASFTTAHVSVHDDDNFDGMVSNILRAKKGRRKKKEAAISSKTKTTRTTPTTTRGSSSSSTLLSAGNDRDDDFGRNNANLGRRSTDSNNTGQTNDGAPLYIQFSLCFQRYVVFHLENNRNHSPTVDLPVRHVIGSYKFLDEALISLDHNNHNTSNIVMKSSLAIKEYFHNISSLAHSWSLQSSSNSHQLCSSVENDYYKTKSAAANDGAAADNEIYYQSLLKQLATLVQPIHPVTKKAYFALNDTRKQLSQMIPRQRFFQFSSSDLKQNYESIMDLFTRFCNGGNNKTVENDEWIPLLPGLGFSYLEAQGVISTFPHIVLYDVHEIKERIKLLTLPLPPRDQLRLLSGVMINNNKQKAKRRNKKEGEELDWPLLSSLMRGYGAGFTIQQATECIRAVPELLALYYEDATKPSIPYFYSNWKITPADADEARYNILNNMAGCSASDAYCFAYMHKIIGISWASINIMIQALPSTSVCNTVPWDIIVDDRDTRSSGSGRASELKFHSLNFLRQRLQISATDVHYMVKTHSRLGGYEVNTNIKPTLDDIQLHLGLTCTELRKLMLRMPSLIGMKTSNSSTSDYHGKGSSAGLFRRLSFFQEDMGMSLEQIRSAVIKQPALLQYSVEDNLRSKLEFFTNELAIDKSRLAKIVQNSPSIFGLSLERNLRLKVKALMDHCYLTAEEVGMIVLTAPSILSLSITRNILPTLQFIESNLLMECCSINNRSKVELGEIILKVPRILLHSVEFSLLPKIKLVEGALLLLRQKQQQQQQSETAINEPSYSDGDDAEFSTAAAIIKSNPALLLTSIGVLENRLNRILEETKEASSMSSLKKRLLPNKNRRKNKSSMAKLGARLDRGSTTGVSISNDNNNAYHSMSDKRTAITRDIFVFEPMILADNIAASETNVIEISLLALGRVYPPDDPNGVRGIRKSKGITVSFLNGAISSTESSNNLNDKLPSHLRLAANACFGTIVPEENGLTNFEKGLVCVGASFLRPSRRRCDLYACHAGLKICLQLLKQSAAVATADGCYINRDIVINIFTDSQYAWDLLKESHKLDKWAYHKSVYEFETNFLREKEKKIKGALPPLYFINSDILFPLCQTYKRLKDGNYSKLANDGSSEVRHFGSKVSVEFRHVGDEDSPLQSSRYYRDFLFNATRAANDSAVWQFNRTKYASNLFK